MTPTQITKGEYDITIVNEVFAKLFYTELSAKFQKFVNDWRTGFVQVNSEDFEKLKEILSDYNSNQISLDEFAEKTNSIVNQYF